MRVFSICRMAERCVSLYKELAKIPTPVCAFGRQIKCNGNLEIISHWEERDLSRMEKIVFQKSYIVGGLQLDAIASTTPVEQSNELLRAYSPFGRVAILRSVPNKQGTDNKQYLEIWSENSKLKCVDLLAQEKHLQVLADGQFGSLKWSPCGNKLLYVAEKFYKAESWFKSAKQGDTDEKKTNVQKGGEFFYRESWGETLSQTHSPSVYIFDVDTEEIQEVAGVGENITCGQAVWTPDSSGVVFVGWNQDPFRLGLIYCNNRRSALYHAHLKNGVCDVIGDVDYCVEYPRFSPDGKVLVYLQSAVGGPHRNTQALVRCEWPSKKVTTVVDVVHHAEPGEFPGIYAMSVPNRIWLADSSSVILHSIWRSRQELISVDVANGDVSRLTDDPVFGNWTLLDVFEDTVVAVPSAPNRRPSLVLMKYLHGRGGRQTWVHLDDNARYSCDLDWETLRLSPPEDSINHKWPKLDYEALFVTPGCSDVRQKHPLIVLPHGGPHATLCATYYMSVEYFCRLGFAILLVNYRGSLGFGQDNVDSLLGYIGSQDVDDVMFSVESAMKSGKIDDSRVVLYGGSHGGFLVLSIAGLYPDRYRACVARNPVVDIGGMAGTTDIPDWNFSESGFTYSYTSLADPDVFKAMWERSPIRLADKIKIPVLFTLGRNDLRVPHIHGVQMHKALRARNVESRIYMYDDSHALQKVDAESDGLINCAQWMLKYTE